MGVGEMVSTLDRVLAEGAGCACAGEDEEWGGWLEKVGALRAALAEGAERMGAVSGAWGGWGAVRI